MSVSPADVVGYPRPVVTAKSPDGTPKRYPLPWINGQHGVDGDFYSFRDDMTRAHEERLCCVCGENLGVTVVVAALDGKRETSGGWGHPKCIRLAVRLCPHFARRVETDTVAWLYVGEGVGVLEPGYSIDDVVDEAQSLDRFDLAGIASRDPRGQEVWL